MTEQEEFEFRNRLELERAGRQDHPGAIASVAAGLGKGFGQTALGAQQLLGKGLRAIGADSAGGWLVEDAAAGRKRLDAELQPYKDAHPIAAGGGEFGGEMLATLPVGGALAAPLKAAARYAPAAAPYLAPVADAIATTGMRAGGATGKAALATRMLGGAITGAASSELVSPDQNPAVGAGIGAAVPVVGKLAAYAGNAIGGAVAPLFNSGQQKIAGKALKQFSTTPNAAQNLRGAVEVIPGSAPTAAMAAGDEGLAGLNRTLQSMSPELAAESAVRQATQNTARTAALEAVAGNPGKIAAAKAARATATDAMREQALAAAGKIDTSGITSSIERMLADPNNAGQTARAGLMRALGQVREIAGDTGMIDARALYEIRKDIGLAMNGKLQGEAGNLRYARGTLDRVQSLIDQTIEGAVNRVQATGTALTVPGANVALPGAAGAAAARPSWKGYLSEYARQSVPIDQMEVLADVLRRVQTGTVDRNGNAVLSAANLNNLLKNDGADLLKKLNPGQIDLLRRLRADLNAQQLAANSGKAVGSNTVQNLGSAGMLRNVLGERLSGSTPVQSLMQRPVSWLYKRADQNIVEKLNDAMLNPQLAADLMDGAGTQGAVAQLFSNPGVRQLGYRAAPVLAAQ